jgi:prepilin-type N-terminal cleavage/methylation domain-containing protein
VNTWKIPAIKGICFIFAGGLKYASLTPENGEFGVFFAKQTRKCSNRRTSELLKTRLLNQKAVQFPPRGRAGMTLVEVVISLAIAALMVGGIVEGYIYCTTSAVKAELAQAANAKAMQRLEEARSAVWDTSSYPAVDQLVASNFPDEVVTLDLPGTNSAGTLATIQTTIVQFSLPPPLSAPVRKIHVDCIWQFRGAELITNSIESIRAPN